jgi:diaminopimelate decarboxylase
MEQLESLQFLTKNQVKEITKKWETPVYVYSEAKLLDRARKALRFAAPYGLTVRYAMKANPNKYILKTFDVLGVKIDASSGYEAERAIKAGVAPENILITSQELPKKLEQLVVAGVGFNACSLHQLHEYGKLFEGSNIGIRLNPGLGSGHSDKTNVGGPASSFGIWHEQLDEVKEVANKYNLTIVRIHTHIGSGNDPKIWTKAAKLTLEMTKKFKNVRVINLGGGFKVARMKGETDTDLGKISNIIESELKSFYKTTGRKLKLEIEPGTFLVANAGALITTIIDIVNTGKDGYTFIKVNSGMTDILRPGLYGAQHPVIVNNYDPVKVKKYIVVGHCCESGDLLTPEEDDPTSLEERQLQKANIGDQLVIEGAGAYCSSMSAKNYNSFPSGAEVMIKTDGEIIEVSRPETLEDVIRLEN